MVSSTGHCWESLSSTWRSALSPTLSWWIVLIPFALALAWWAWADASGYTKRKVIEQENARRQERIDRQKSRLGTLRNSPHSCSPPGWLTACSRPPPDRGQHQRPGEAGSAVFLEWVAQALGGRFSLLELVEDGA